MYQNKNLVAACFCLAATTALAKAKPPTPPSLSPTGSEATLAAAQPIDASFTSKSVSAGTSTKDAAPSLKDRLALNYWGIYFGPSVGSASDYNPSYDGTAGDVQNLDGVITAGYRPTKQRLIGIGIPQIYTPFREEKGLIISNVFVRLSDSEVIRRGKFKVGLGSRVYLPTKSDSRNAGFVTGVRFEQNVTYDVPGVPLTLGLFTYERPYFYNSKASKGNPLTLYGAPYANYLLTQRLAATLWIDLVQLKQAKGQSVSDMRNFPVGVQPGISWDVNDKLSLNPYLNMYPGNLTADSSSLGLIVSAKVL